MEVLRPTTAEIAAVNQSRAGTAQKMVDMRGFTLVSGVCMVDDNRLPGGELASERHARDTYTTIQDLENVEVIARYNGVKPRTHIGRTGLLHEINGPQIYVASARSLILDGISLAAEVMDESDYAIAASRLTVAWTGTRNADDTGTRYLLRPTEEDREQEIHPLPTFVKNSPDGSHDSMLNTINTLKDRTTRTRTRLTLDGLKTVTTYANPYVGVILRGNNLQQPTDNLDDLILNEVGEAQEVLDREFDDPVPVIFDISHRHAQIAGGGERGQLRNAEAIARLISKGLLNLFGMMAETYIHGGKQPENGKIAGQSQADHCVSQGAAIRAYQQLDSALETAKVLV